MIGRMLNSLIRRAGEGDLEAIEQLQAIERLASQAYSCGLVEARQDAGYSHAELAAVVGTSRQNLAQRQRRAEPAACGHHRCVGMKKCRTPDQSQRHTPGCLMAVGIVSPSHPLYGVHRPCTCPQT